MSTTAESLEWPYCVDRVVSRQGGLISSTGVVRQQLGHPKLKVFAASMGDLGRLFTDPGSYRELRLSGTGRSFDQRFARSIAISEAIERYSSCVFSHHHLVTASAVELGTDALDLSTIPRSSARELEDARCLVPPADPRASMRWVESIELVSGRRVWVPAVMVFLRLPPLHSERFWLPISTGCAAHTSMRSALVAALCEVIERDAVAVTWLQRLRLPLLSRNAISPVAEGMLAWGERSHMKTYLFDATTDLRVPTVYTLTLAPSDSRVAQTVGCAASVSIRDAVEKVVSETYAGRAAVQAAPEPPANVADFWRVLDGAAYLGRPEHRDAFDFLLDQIDSRAESCPADLVEPREDALDGIRLMLERRQMQAYAVNLTTREADAAGLKVVRVIVPALQPTSFRQLAQYRGHPRLFAAPALMGHTVHAESGLNPWPQPFP